MNTSTTDVGVSFAGNAAQAVRRYFVTRDGEILITHARALDLADEEAVGHR